MVIIQSKHYSHLIVFSLGAAYFCINEKKSRQMVMRTYKMRMELFFFPWSHLPNLLLCSCYFSAKANTTTLHLPPSVLSFADVSSFQSHLSHLTFSSHFMYLCLFSTQIPRHTCPSSTFEFPNSICQFKFCLCHEAVEQYGLCMSERVVAWQLY